MLVFTPLFQNEKWWNIICYRGFALSSNTAKGGYDMDVVMIEHGMVQKNSQSKPVSAAVRT